MIETIVLGGGCFWCTEAVFQRLRGVTQVIPGYAGGTTENPTYESVSTGSTGHAEVIEVTYNSEVITFTTLLEVFFAIHDPTTMNRQGPDYGSQYRSIILTTTKQQLDEAKSFIKGPVVTEVLPLRTFYPAESNHRNYFETHSNQPYCKLIIDPKVKKLLHQFPDSISDSYINQA